MDKRKLSNLLLVIAVVLMLTVFASSVRLKAAPDAEARAGKEPGCCCLPGRDTQKTVKE